MSNLEFWNAVEQTPPSQTAKANVSGQNRTMVDAQYKKKCITEAFGMYGTDWGVEPESEQFERNEYQNNTVILTYRAIAFYEYGGKKGRFPIAASIKESYVTKNGQGYLKIDDEAIKKVRTDALTKGFTDLGFNADIHLGKFDDNHYVEAARAKEYIEKSEEADKLFQAEVDKLKKWLTENVEAAKTITTDSSFVKAMNRIKDQTINRCNPVGINPTPYLERIDQLIGERENASK